VFGHEGLTGRGVLRRVIHVDQGRELRRGAADVRHDEVHALWGEALEIGAKRRLLVRNRRIEHGVVGLAEVAGDAEAVLGRDAFDDRP